MSTNFPTTLDSLTNPVASDAVATVDHAAQHANANDSIEALEAKVGVDSSAVTTSLDYKLKSTSSTDPGHKHTESSITLADNTTNDATSTKHGFVPKTPADATKFLNGAATAAYALVKDSDLSTSDITTNDVSTSKHGFAPKGTNTGTKFLRDDATWATPSTGATCVTSFPSPLVYTTGGTTDVNENNTTMYVGLVNVPASITANKISFYNAAVGTSGTVKLALFSEDGQTQLFSVVTGTISGAGVNTVALSSVAITSGNYYIAVLEVDTANVNVKCYTTTSAVNSLNGGVTSEPVLEGTITVTANTVPATITPGSITTSDNKTLIFRLDN